MSEEEYQNYLLSKGKRFVCDICDSGFTLKQNVQTHLRVYHPVSGGCNLRRRCTRYRCIACDMVNDWRITE